METNDCCQVYINIDLPTGEEWSAYIASFDLDHPRFSPSMPNIANVIHSIAWMFEE